MDEVGLMALIADGENERCDFKRELRLDTARAKAEFVKDIISLANSGKPTGYLLVGVDDDGYIAGTGEIDEAQIQSICSSYITPPAVVSFELVPLTTPTPILVGVLEIRARRRPHKVARPIENIEKEEVFVRRGSTVAKAAPEEIVSLAGASRAK